MANDLETLSQVRRMLAECRKLSQIREIRDKAEAVRKYRQAARESTEAVNAASLVKALAERRGGELLQSMKKAAGVRGQLNGRNSSGAVAMTAPEELAPTLSEMGLTHSDSVRWQTLVNLAEKEIEAVVAEATAANREVTSKSLYSLGKKKKARQAAPARPKSIEGIVADLSSLPRGKFATVYADPPWKYGNQATRASTDNHYPTMAVAEICAMPVAAVASEGARLFLWATTGFLRESFDVIQAWGFEYRSQIIWCKPQMGIGNYCRVSHEILMIATRPGIKAWDGRDKAIKSWHVADRTKHSEKPELFRGIVEKLSPGPYLELFGRVTAKGWTTHGNQICRSEG